MRKKFCVFAVVFQFLVFADVNAQQANSAYEDSIARVTRPLRIHPERLAIMASTGVAGLVSSYLYVKNAWWSNQKTSFHFDHDMDYRYAKNIDKGAHFIGGVIIADLFKDGFYWSGLKAERSFFWAFISGSLMQSFVEIKDGYAPTYGFSWGDVGAGTLGSLVPYLKYKYPKLYAFDIKLSYYRHDDYYYKMFPHAEFIDDYMNHTYWLALNPNDLLPKNSKTEKLWPDFLCIVGGWGVDNTLDYYYTGLNLDENKGKGNYEFYLSIDIDWRKIIRQDTHFKKAVTSTLNYIKLPLPTLRFTPTLKYYWMFL